MTEILEIPHLISDAEKTFAFLARMSGQLDNIKTILDEDSFLIDMYGDDPGGVNGIITNLQRSGASPIFMNYNGPYVIETILATWATGVGSASTLAEGNVTSPGAGATIASALIGPGVWSIEWEVGLAGTPGAGDANNFNLTNGGLFNLGSINPGAVGGPWPQDTAQITTTTAVTAISVKTIAAGTVGAIYSAQLVLTKLDTPSTVTLQLKDRTLQLLPASGIFNPQGLKFQMDRDDQVILTVSPAVACHLEINGHIDKRRMQ